MAKEQNKKEKRHTKGIVAAVSLALAAGMILYGFYSSHNCITVTHYSLDVKTIDTPVRIVQICTIRFSERTTAVS